MESDSSLTPTKCNQLMIIRTPSRTGLNSRETESIRTKLADQESEALLIRIATID